MVFGLMVLFVGIIFLLQNLGYLTADVWSIIWPIMIIAVGISILTKPLLNKENKENKKD